jgi:microcystin-dependent protein
MSFRRIQSQTNNRNVYLENRLNNFTKPPMHEGDLYVERDEVVYGNLSVGKDLRSNNFYATGNYYLDTFVLIPAGTIIMSAATTEPGGWLDCNGRTLLKGEIGSTYYDLFLAIGYTYGGSDLSFNIPDMQGRVGVGQGSGTGLTPRTLADISGAETHTLTVAQMPDHSHTNNSTNNLGLAKVTGANTASTGLDETATEIDLFQRPTALTIDSVGGGLPHNNMQPYVVLRYLIKY